MSLKMGVSALGPPGHLMSQTLTRELGRNPAACARTPKGIVPSSGPIFIPARSQTTFILKKSNTHGVIRWLRWCLLPGLVK